MRKLAFVLILLIVALGIAAWWLRRESRPVTLRAPVLVDIAPGTGATGIAARLVSSGVLRSRWPFLAWHFLRPTRQILQAGEYQFSGQISPFQVYGKLVRGDIHYYVLTIPEGYNIFEAAGVVGRSGLASADAFLEAARDPTAVADLAPGVDTLEGFLFPDTYRFPRHVTARQIAQTMVARFRRVYAQLARLHGQRGSHVREMVTMASLVEKETGKPDERALVAGVYQNRLDRGVLLQCDPTVVYAAILAGRYRGTIYQSDLKRDHPYNTYMRSGLPPGPVANPGRTALEAALSPSLTGYLYFVSDAEGGHVFSRTLAEHNRRVSAYRQKMRRQSG